MSPRIGRALHRLGMIFWANNLWLYFFLPRSWQITYIALCSIYANFVGHWSGLSAERPTELVKEEGGEVNDS